MVRPKLTTKNPTFHEAEIISRLKSGYSLGRIADDMVISESRVKYISDKFGIKCCLKNHCVKSTEKNTKWINLSARYDGSGYF